MFSSQSAELALEVPCRIITALPGDSDHHRFVVGSSRVNHKNHLYVLRYHSSLNELVLESTLHCDDGAEIRAMASQSQLLFVATSHKTNGIYRLPQEPDNENDELEGSEDRSVQSNVTTATANDSMMNRVAQLVTDADVVSVAWRDTSEHTHTYTTNTTSGDILLLESSGQLSRWDLSATGTTSRVSIAPALDDTTSSLSVPSVAWDPHSEACVAVTHGTRVSLLDWRVDPSVPTGLVDSFVAHRYGVTSLDYNPNKPYVLGTAGQDGMIKFWDLRRAKYPLLTIRGGHSHYATVVRYNPFHDQLVLTAGTDASSQLWRVSSISSAPLLTLDNDAPNVRVQRHEHGEAVYGACWGASDAWIYVTVSYDGTAVLQHVPSHEKYKILL